LAKAGGTSYLGKNERRNRTLKGFCHVRKIMGCNLFRVGTDKRRDPG
jgi:hypothetical protein